MADPPNDEALHLVKAGPDQGVSGSSDHIEQLISSSSVLALEGNQPSSTSSRPSHHFRICDR